MFSQKTSYLSFSCRSAKVVCCTLVALFCWLWTADSVWAQTPNCPLYPSPHLRIGINVALDGGVSIANYNAAQLNAGWYLDYARQQQPVRPNGMLYAQMIRTGFDTTKLASDVGPIVDANPGAVWLLGNEPDRHGQDGKTPAEYAVFYHTVYTFLKQRDPTSRIAIAGVVQVTPIRLRYLNMVLAEYQQRYGVALPVDILNIHTFILPENAPWGAGIPLGLEEFRAEGVPEFDLPEHANLATVQQQIVTFRQWMKDHGYRDKPLIISEYGILLSRYHGFTYSVVRNFMLGSFDLFATATDSATGYPADGNRLVQEWSWFSLNFYEYNLVTSEGLNGNLFDHDSRAIQPLGVDFANYTSSRVVNTIDLRATDLRLSPSTAAPTTAVTLRASFVNGGGVAAQNGRVRFYLGDPRSGGQLLGTSAVTTQVLPDCNLIAHGEVVWTPSTLTPGTYTIFAQLVADNSNLDTNTTNNYINQTLTIGTSTTGTPLALQAGWNLIAYPHLPASTAPATLLSSISGQYNLVYAYDGCTAANPWQKYNPSGPPFANTLTTVTPQRGLWIRTQSATTLPVTGVNPAQVSIPLCAGWNLISYPADGPVAITTALASLAGKYNLVYAYNASNTANPWQKYNPSGPPFANTLTELKPGVGYWIRMTSPATLVVD